MIEQLVVIAHEIVGGPRHGHALLEQAHLELAQALLAAVVGVRDERGHRHAALGRRLQRRLDLGAIEPEDDDVHALRGVLDGRHERRDPVLGLNQQLHRRVHHAATLRRMAATASVQKRTDRNGDRPTLEQVNTRPAASGGALSSPSPCCRWRCLLFAQDARRHGRDLARPRRCRRAGPGERPRRERRASRARTSRSSKESDSGTSPKFDVRRRTRHQVEGQARRRGEVGDGRHAPALGRRLRGR